MQRIPIDLDEAESTVLDDSLNKTNTISVAISKKLNDISYKSTLSAKKLKPLISDIDALKIYNDNIDNMMLILRDVKDYAKEASQYQTTLNRIGSIDNANDCKKYISSIDQARSTLNNQDQSQEGGIFKGVNSSLIRSINDAELHLITTFRNLLIENSKPFDPQMFMTKREAFPFFEEETVGVLRLIFAYFERRNQDAKLVKVVVEQRFRLVYESMERLEMFVKPTLNSITYEKNSNGVNNYSEAFISFITNENAFYEELFESSKNKSQLISDTLVAVFEKLIDNFIRLIKELTDFIETHLDTHGFLSFEVIESCQNVRKYCHDYDLDSCISSQAKQMLNLIKNQPIKVFSNILRDIDNGYLHLSSLPTDPTTIVRPISELTNKLKRINGNKESCWLVMQDIGPKNWLPLNTANTPEWRKDNIYLKENLEPSKDSKLNLAKFVCHCIECAILNLHIKGKELKYNGLGVLVYSNFYFLEEFIHRSNIERILGSYGETRLQKLEKKNSIIVTNDWMTVTQPLIDQTIITGTQMQDNLSTSKGRDAIKERFKTFNQEFEKIVQRYKNYNITDPTLKKKLLSSIVAMAPLYYRFYDKYNVPQFLKHGGSKVIKYDKSGFDRMLDSI
ncbi:hypothetical protein LJB42_003410 [Komagataella kurtzmanii]|nr:hypothetical protein LJB42_003410 [Komagataella kurtzmanii]